MDLTRKDLTVSKTTKKPDSAAPATAKTPTPSPATTAWPADEFTGRGGRYVRDPVTGERRPAPAADDEPQAAADAA